MNETGVILRCAKLQSAIAVEKWRKPEIFTPGRVYGHRAHVPTADAVLTQRLRQTRAPE